MTQRCKCCGQPLPGSPSVDLEAAPLAKLERRIVDALSIAHPRAVTIDALIDQVYFDDADGGPIDARSSVASTVARMRKLLPRYGWTIPRGSRGRGVRGTYKLTKASWWSK